MNDTLKSMSNWHALARPNPTAENFDKQLACHFEEFLEMMETLQFDGEGAKLAGAYLDLCSDLQGLTDLLKAGRVQTKILDRNEFLDSLADQIVTAVGVGHCARMNTIQACERVDTSNWSKFIDGKPVFDAQGKIAKPNSYVPPNLEGLF